MSDDRLRRQRRGPTRSPDAVADIRGMVALPPTQLSEVAERIVARMALRRLLALRGGGSKVHKEAGVRRAL